MHQMSSHSAPIIEPLESRLQLSGQGGEITGPSGANFGSLAVGDTQHNEEMITITNTGSQSVQLDTPFSHDTSQATIDIGGFPVGGFLNPGSSASFGVVINTGGNLSVSTMVTAEYNDGNNQFFDVPVTATVGTGSTPDTTAPTAKITYAKALRVATKYYYFAVTYTDDKAVDKSTLDSSDILVSRRKYPTLHANFISVTPNANAASVTAVYAVRYGRTGTWTSAFDGLWTISLAGNQVADTSGNHAVAKTLGQVAFLIPTVAAKALPAVAKPAVTPFAAVEHRAGVWDDA
jgi:hypothetical protein